MDASALVTPPYVAGPLTLHPFRALMLVPGRVGTQGTGRAFTRPYHDVADRLGRWEKRGDLIRGSQPALYLHEYTSDGMTVRGLVGALDVSRRATRPQDRAVLPHEGIRPTQADDLADRLDQMEVNPAPILLVHRGTELLRSTVARIAAAEPDHAFTDRSGQQHQIWAIRSSADLTLIAEQLAPNRALIADGHHRYAAYLRLQRRNAASGNPPTNRGLAMLVDQSDTPLFLGAIHRSLEGTTFAHLRDAVETLGLDFRLTPQPEAVAALAPTRLIATNGEDWAVITLQLEADEAAVEALHRQIVPALPQGPTGIGYHHTVDSALDAAARGSITVLMPALSVDTVLAVAAADRLLPEKATSFQPKPALGVLIRSLRDEANDQN